jgi:hypothetical protein
LRSQFDVSRPDGFAAPVIKSSTALPPSSPGRHAASNAGSVESARPRGLAPV